MAMAVGQDEKGSHSLKDLFGDFVSEHKKRKQTNISV